MTSGIFKSLDFKSFLYTAYSRIAKIDIFF